MPVGGVVSASESTHIGRSGVPRKRSFTAPGPRPASMEPVLKYVPTEHGWQDVFWQGERIGTVKLKDRRWTAFTASGAPAGTDLSAGTFGTRRAAGAHLRRLIEGRRAA